MSFGASATELGVASYYGAAGLTAAHRSLPMGSRVKVLNLDNGRSVILRIMDRGPFIRGRVIDVRLPPQRRSASGTRDWRT
jgi:rare lipoprotein A